MLQLTKPAKGHAAVKPTRHGHNFTAKRHRGKPRVAPLATVDRLESTAPPSTERVWCPRCDKCHAVAVDYEYINNPAGVRTYVNRVGYCDGCEMIYWWQQACNATGQPMGRFIKGSLVTNDKASSVEKVLRVYPQLRGIEHEHPHY